jgi:hypothetical protein
MEQVKKRSVLAGIFFLCSFFLPAQITISLDKDTISFNETVTLRLSGEVRNATEFAELPQSDGLLVVSRTNNYTLIGNSNRAKFSQTFTLSPFKVGTFTIGPAWVQTGSNRVFSNKVTLTVKQGNTETASNDIFMRCVPDKKKAVLGEQITLAIVLYYRPGMGLWAGEDRPLAKTFNGFWYHEGLTTQTYKDSTMLINGLVYNAKTIYKEYVFPNTTGKLTIPSYEYDCFIKENPFPTGDPLVDDVMGMQVPIQLNSPEVPIEVSPLPDKDKPANFSGDVGKYSLSASVDKVNVKAFEAVKLSVMVKGKGNISFVQLPPLTFPDGIESYPPVTNDTTSVTSSGIEGEKTFVYTLIPKKPGAFTLPGVSFSYFDSQKNKYETVQTPEFRLDVAPGDSSQNVSQNNLPETFPDGNSSVTRRVLWIVVPAVLLALLVYFRRKKPGEEKTGTEDKAEIKEEVAVPVKHSPDILSMLSTAERYFMTGNVQSGWNQLYETLMSAVLFKTELNREEASVHQLGYRLRMKMVGEENIATIISFLDELNTLRYQTTDAAGLKLSEKFEKTRNLSLSLIN